MTDTYALDASALFTEFYFDVNDQHKITLGLRYTEDTKAVEVNNYFYKVPLISAWNPLNKGDCDIQANGSSGAITAKASGLNEFTTTLNTAQCFTGGVTGDHANTVGQRVGVNPGQALPNMTNGSLALNPLPALNADYTKAGVSPSSLLLKLLVVLSGIIK